DEVEGRSLVALVPLAPRDREALRGRLHGAIVAAVAPEQAGLLHERHAARSEVLVIEACACERTIEGLERALGVAEIAAKLSEQAQRLDLRGACARLDRRIERAPQQRLDACRARRIEVVPCEPREGQRDPRGITLPL